MVNGPSSPTRGASLQERLERSRRHKKWLTDQQPQHEEEDRPAASESEQRQPGSRIRQIVQANQDRKKKSPVVSLGTTAAVLSPSSHLESSRSSRSSLSNHRVVAMPDNHPTRNGGRSLTSSYHSRSGAASPLPNGQKRLQEGKEGKQDPLEVSSKVATTTTGSAAKDMPLSPPPPTSPSVSATFLHWQQRERRDLAGKKTPSSTSRQQQHQRQPASPATSSFAFQFSQQYVVKTDSKKQPTKVDASNADDDDDQMSYSSHSLSSVSRVSSSTHSSTVRSWAGGKPSAGQNFRTSTSIHQFTKQQQTSSPASHSHQYQQRSIPYSQQPCRGGASTNLKKTLTNNSRLQQGVPAINRDGTTNFKQLLKPVRDRDACDDGSQQQMAYGAVIETPKKASVSNLHAMFNSKGSSEPIMPMNSKDPRIRNSLPVALSLPQLQGQQQQQNQKNSNTSNSNSRCSQGKASTNNSWTGNRLSDNRQSDQLATPLKNGGDLDEKVATAAPADIADTPINEANVTSYDKKVDPVAKHSNQRNGDSLPSPSQHQYVGDSSRESVVASWREHVHETQDTLSKEPHLVDEPTETSNKEPMKGKTMNSYKQPQVDGEPQSGVPVQRSSLPVKPWEVDTKNSVVQSWEARKSKDRLSKTSSENNDRSAAVSPTSSIQSPNVEDEVPIQSSSVTEDDVENKSSDQEELLDSEVGSAQDTSLDQEKILVQKQTVSGTTEGSIEEEKSRDLSDNPDDVDKILDDAILDHLALAKAGGSNGSGTDYDGVEEDVLLGSSHSGRITSDSSKEEPHSRSNRSHSNLEQAGSEELSLYTTDERTASVSGFGLSVFDPFQNSHDAESALEQVGVAEGEVDMSTPMAPLGESRARCPRLSPSPKDCDKYRSTYFGDEVISAPRAGSTLEAKSNTTKTNFSPPNTSDVATKQDSPPSIVPTSASKQEKQEQLSFDDTDQWLNKYPDFSLTDDKNVSPSSAGKDGAAGVPTRSTSGPGKKGASVGQEKVTSSKAEVAVAVTETRQDVFDPFEDVSETPSGFFSPEHDPFNPFSGLDWPVRQTSNHEIEDIDDLLTDKNRMEI